MIFPGPNKRNSFAHPQRNHPNYFNLNKSGPHRSFFNKKMNPNSYTPNQKQSLASLVNKGVGGLSKSLSNIQQVLNVVDSAAPVVQQYGPMIKNIPTMYRMIKAFKEIEKEDESTLKESENLEEKSPEISSDDVVENTEEVKARDTNGQSIPKLFI